MSIARIVLTVSAGLVCLFPAGAWAGAPTDQTKSTIDQVIRTVEDPALKQASMGEERRAAIRKQAEALFDFTETAKRALGRHWPELSDVQQREFVSLFTGSAGAVVYHQDRAVWWGADRLHGRLYRGRHRNRPDEVHHEAGDGDSRRLPAPAARRSMARLRRVRRGDQPRFELPDAVRPDHAHRLVPRAGSTDAGQPGRVRRAGGAAGTAAAVVTPRRPLPSRERPGSGGSTESRPDPSLRSCWRSSSRLGSRRKP